LVSRTGRARPVLDTKLFGKWDTTTVVVTDPGLRNYINLDPVNIPHTEARHANRWFGKSRVSIVERYTNQLMRTGRFTGKKSKALKAVDEAFDIIAKQTKENPVQILVRAVENAAPREEVTRLKYGGISVPKAVDVAPSRRLDVALRNLATGAINASHKSKNTIAACVARELVRAAKNEGESFAIGKKEEVERVAGSAR